MNTAMYATLVLDQLRAILRPAGFRKRGRIFSAPREDVLLLVQLQGSPSSTGERLIVTVNLAIHSYTLQEWGELGGSQIGPYGCHWHQRLGMISPYLDDHWWTVDDPASAVAAGAEIAALLAGFGLPLLERLSSTQRLRDHWLAGGYGGISEMMRCRYLRVLERD